MNLTRRALFVVLMIILVWVFVGSLMWYVSKSIERPEPSPMPTPYQTLYPTFRPPVPTFVPTPNPSPTSTPSSIPTPTPIVRRSGGGGGGGGGGGTPSTPTPSPTPAPIAIGLWLCGADGSNCTQRTEGLIKAVNIAPGDSGEITRTLKNNGNATAVYFEVFNLTSEGSGRLENHFYLEIDFDNRTTVANISAFQNNSTEIGEIQNNQTLPITMTWEFNATQIVSQEEINKLQGTGINFAFRYLPKQ